MSAVLGHHGLLFAGDAWSPADLATPPKFWLDEVSAVINASGAASQWNDRSGNGAHFSNSTANQRPTINATGLNGKRTLSFDGVNDNLQNNDSAVRGWFSSVSSGWGLTVVRRTASTSKVSTIFKSSTGTGTGRFAFYSGANVAGYETAGSLVMRRQDADSAGVLRSSTSYGTSWAILYFEANWSAGTGRIITNGGAPQSSSLTSAGNTAAALSSIPVYIGTEATGNFGDNEMFLLIGGAGGLPDSTEIDKLFGWAAWKAGLAANLPPGHPYKDSPP